MAKYNFSIFYHGNMKHTFFISFDNLAIENCEVEGKKFQFHKRASLFQTRLVVALFS